MTEDSYKKPVRRAPPVPASQSRLRGEQASVHSYEEICGAGETELASVLCSLDLSPVYEEIPGGGSRSSLSSSAGSRSSRSSCRSSSPR